MIKYSIIIPVYNAAPYISKCIESVLNQGIEEYEIIIVNDGSTDDSSTIIKSFDDSKIRYFEKENGGVSDARNYGINKVEGEYFTFVDADDYVSSEFLKVIDNNIKKETEVLSFNIAVKDKFDKLIKEIRKPIFSNIDGQKAIVKFIQKGEMFDTPVAYVYKTSYFKDNDFMYAKGKVHEDFGLTPLIILKSNCITSISNYLYYYVINDTSITKDVTLSKKIKRAWDMLYHFDYLYLNVNDDVNIKDNVKKIFNSFIANALISKASTLNGEKQNEYIEELKNRNVSDLLISDNVNRLIKKTAIKISPKLYIKIFLRRR